MLWLDKLVGQVSIFCQKFLVHPFNTNLLTFRHHGKLEPIPPCYWVKGEETPWTGQWSVAVSFYRSIFGLRDGLVQEGWSIAPGAVKHCSALSNDKQSKVLKNVFKSFESGIISTCSTSQNRLFIDNLTCLTLRTAFLTIAQC